MTQEEFGFQIRRLAEVYGDRHFPQERVDIFWNKLKIESAVVFERSVTHLIATMKSAPMLDDLKSAISFWQSTKQDKTLTREDRIRLLQERNVHCEVCGDSGSVWARHKENGNKYTFKCTCEFSEQEKRWPVWGVKFENEYQHERE